MTASADSPRRLNGLAQQYQSGGRVPSGWGCRGRPNFSFGGQIVGRYPNSREVLDEGLGRGWLPVGLEGNALPHCARKGFTTRTPS
jgi:hypothetical protein